MGSTTYPLPPIESRPLPLTEELCLAIEGAVAEFRAFDPDVRVGPVPPIRVVEPGTLLAISKDVRQSWGRDENVWGLYCNNPSPVILAEDGLPPFIVRSLIRHELAHWWLDVADRLQAVEDQPVAEAFAGAFGRDPRFRADVAALGLPKDQPGWTHRPFRDGKGGLEWRVVPREVRVLFHEPAAQAGRIPAAASGVFDSDEAYEHFFLIPDQISITTGAQVWLRFHEFTASAKTAASSGTLTSDSGGGSTTVSGGGSTSAASSDHNHDFGVYESNSPGAYTKRLYNTPGATFNLETSAAADMSTYGENALHNHGTPNHQHATPNHQHTVPGHTHGLTYGIFKEPMPASINVNLTIYRKEFGAGAWTLVGTVNGLDEAEILVDLSPYVVGPGVYRIDIQSAAGQPNGGRLTVDVTGVLFGAIQSA